MPPKVIVTIDVILHATEDPTKIEKSLHDIFEIEQEEFENVIMSGHFGNPILILKTKISKNNSKKLISTLISKISDDDLETLEKEIDQMDKNSGLQIRISKQDIINGRISLGKKDSIKLTITSPVYKKNEIGKIYREILNIQ